MSEPHNESVKIPSILHVVLLSLLLLTSRSLAALELPAPPTTLVFSSDKSDDMVADSLSAVIAGIGEVADVAVFRVALTGDYTLLAEVLPLRPKRRVPLNANVPGRIAVIYPDIDEPYRSIFTRIIEGIESKAEMHVASFAVGAGQNIQEISAELRRLNVQVVITLGRNGLKAANNLDQGIRIVVGGVISLPEQDVRTGSVYSLAPDPRLLFERLKAMMPGARRIFVVYDSSQNDWLIRQARDAAKSLDLEMVSKEAGDIKTAMSLYKDLLASADPRKDALWLPQDSVTAEESSTLPFVLQEAWNRALPVFSSSLAHVKRGALFSLYPNEVELGRTLASSALSLISSRHQSTNITPLKEVLMAVNLRTCAHLGLNINQRQQQSFSMIFPSYQSASSTPFTP